ncbi:MAG: DUF998 domain-containing protein [Actinomycetota bacterium]
MTTTAHQRVGSSSGLARGLGFVGLAGVLAFLGTVVVLHLVRADLSPVNDFVSDYANGRLNALFTVGVLAHGAGNAAIAVGLARDLGPGRAARTGATLFALAAVGLLVAGLFRTDPAGAAASLEGVIHARAATLSFPVELLALLLLSSAFRASPAWQTYGRRSLVLAVVAGVAMLWMFGAVLSSWAPGLAERGALGAFAVWELSTAVRMARGAG